MRDKAVQILRKVLRSPLSLALLGCAAVIALAPAVPAEAGIRDMLNINEQPGVVPTKQESLLPPEFRPQPVYFRSNEPPGTIIINTDERFLYLVQSDNRAIRYGVGVGRDGFQWSGLLKISRKAEWPDWRPPAEMIQRQPYLPRFMAGGEGNPMGARALYLGDTIYRIHGTNQPQTIGHALSSGCFRMVNNDVMDLYERVPVGTKVIVRQQAKL
ncbi:L,D-transpeptidase [Kaistia sp. MMO-174]|uniref:L,D-transpeptidase n=1 Tax=Kaistia sp. MMO-174 TaxID=3081256 RepID=UPI003019EF3F